MSVVVLKINTSICEYIIFNIKILRHFNVLFHKFVANSIILFSPTNIYTSLNLYKTQHYTNEI